MQETARDVDVWHVDLRQPADWVEGARALLAPDELEAAARGTPEVRRRRVVRRAALRIALARRIGGDPSALRMVPGPHGKPALADSADALHFSSSSSDDCCLIAVTAIGPIGVDVERVAPRAYLERIAETRFAPAEADAIAHLEGEARLRAFYNCWTRKEAYLKATGAGLTMPLDKVIVSLDDERPEIVSLDGDDPAAWSVESLDPEPGFTGAVVWRGAAVPITGAAALDLNDN